MALQHPGISTSANVTSFSSGSRAPVKEASTPGRFNQVLAQIAPSQAAPVAVRRGDTLIGLVKAQHNEQGRLVSENQAFRLAHQIAADNRISNPDLIKPGQKIDFSRLNSPLVSQVSTDKLESTVPSKPALAQLSSSAQVSPKEISTDNSDHPLLDRVLGRAVGKGFIPGADLSGVRNKIVQLAEKYNFKPDDFARLSLMESGGMNPKASNGHCHGVIQFCDGPARGAAAVGFTNNAKNILGMSLFKQLDLVDQYFSKVGMTSQTGKPGEKQGLDDLYLSILSPAARNELRTDAPLPIAGPQASLLHVGSNQRNPITRNSLVNGLHALTELILSADAPRKGPARIYAEIAQPNGPSTEW